MVLMLMVTEPLFLLDDRGAYFPMSSTTLLLVHFSGEQCKQEFILLVYSDIAWNAFQTLELFEYTCVAREYVIQYLTYPTFLHDTKIPVQRSSTVCMSKWLLCKKPEVILLRRKPNLNFFAKFALSTCKGDDSAPCYLCTALYATSGTNDRIFHSLLSSGQGPIPFPFQNSSSDQRPNFSLFLKMKSIFFVPSPQKSTDALLLLALVPFASH